MRERPLLRLHIHVPVTVFVFAGHISLQLSAAFGVCYKRSYSTTTQAPDARAHVCAKHLAVVSGGLEAF